LCLDKSSQCIDFVFLCDYVLSSLFKTAVIIGGGVWINQL